jgi:hypothetical protein
MPQNAITAIKPYKWQGLWVFDDNRVDLVKEPFVAGADTWIDKAVALRGIEGADQGFLLLFSATPFPGFDLASGDRFHDAGELSRTLGTFSASFRK